MQTLPETGGVVWHRVTSGAILILIACGILVFSWDYPVGSLTEMGPGFMPRCVGLGLAALGGIVLVLDLKASALEPLERPNWRSLIFICSAITIFALIVNRIGLVPAMFLAVSVSMLADSQARPIGIILYSTILTFLGWLLFIQALGLPLSAFWR